MSSVDLDAVGRLESRIQAEIDSGRSLAAQYALGLHGRVVAGRSFGTATDAHRFVIFSATKTIVQFALVPEIASGALELTAPVAEYIPEFGENGKDAVTVLQLLTMQGGFPLANIGPNHWGSSEGRRSRFARWSLQYPAGTVTEYHPVSAHWVIAELIETLAGQPFEDVVHRRVTEPAGAAAILTRTTEAPVVEIRATGQRPTDADADGMAALLAAYGGQPDRVPLAPIDADAMVAMNDPVFQSACMPGGGGRARAADVALVYQHVLADDSPWMRDALRTVRNASINVSDGVPALRTIAGVVAGADGLHRYRWFPNAPRAFGHHGAGGQLCWCDPDTGLSFTFLHDTHHRDPSVTLLRNEELNSLALECVQP